LRQDLHIRTTILPAASSILVVAAHPDDEVLGCGGTIARVAAEGGTVHVALLADGESSRHAEGANSTLTGQLSARRAAAKLAADALGVATLDFHDFPDNRMDSVDLLDIARKIETLIERYRPDTVLTHHNGDVNIDHRRIHDAVVAACRPQPGHPVKQLLLFEIPSSTEWHLAGMAPPFVPNWFVDISAQLSAKRRALEAYASEMRPWPHPRSYEGVEHLARWRGATVGVEAAEAFVLGRTLRNL